jgi:translation elongation factor EF-1beta
MKREGYWLADIKVMLNDNEIAFDELSEETKAEIAEKIIDGYCSGEIQEEIED